MTYHIRSIVTAHGKKNCGDKQVKSDHIRFFLSLRAAFFSSSPNINAIAANCLLENKWGCITDGDKRWPPITCYAGKWLNTTVWTQINLTERRGNDDGTETWRVVWIGPNKQKRWVPFDAARSFAWAAGDLVGSCAAMCGRGSVMFTSAATTFCSSKCFAFFPYPALPTDIPLKTFLSEPPSVPLDIS